MFNLSFLIIIPLMGIFVISNNATYDNKKIALITSILNLIYSLGIYLLFNSTSNRYQFVEGLNLYLGIDGISIYFVLLTTILMPIALISNWSIRDNKTYLVLMLLLESLLLAVFLVLDIFYFYIFFESTLIPLFLLIGLYGSSNKIRASYYIFLYTLTKQCKRAKPRKIPKALVTIVVR